MEDLKTIKNILMDQVESQISNISKVNTHELGEVIDMIKDLEETMYYSSIVKAMEEKESWPESHEWKEEDEVSIDYRAGHSPMARKSYIESKQQHHDKAIVMQNLEKYLKDLTNDVTEMLDDASPEEKAIMRDKITIMANKIK